MELRPYQEDCTNMFLVLVQEKAILLQQRLKV